MLFLKHFLLVLAALPFLPYMVFQGFYIRKKIPKLLPPEDIIGSNGNGSECIQLLTIGESTIAGIGVTSHKEGITGQLAKYLSSRIYRKINWEVFAKSGLTSKEILEKLKNESINISPDIIVIGTGANDGFRLNNPIFFKNNISKIVFFLKNKYPSTPIVFANLPPIYLFPVFPYLIKLFVGKTVDRYGIVLKKITAKHKNVYFDTAKIRELDWKENGHSPNEFFSDGVHPSKLSYQLWADRIGNFILDNDLLRINQTQQA